MNLFESKTNQMMYLWAEGLANLVFDEMILEIQEANNNGRLLDLVKMGFEVGTFSIKDSVLETNSAIQKYDDNTDLLQQFGVKGDEEYANVSFVVNTLDDNVNADIKVYPNGAEITFNNQNLLPVYKQVFKYKEIDKVDAKKNNCSIFNT